MQIGSVQTSGLLKGLVSSLKKMLQRLELRIQARLIPSKSNTPHTPPFFLSDWVI